MNNEILNKIYCLLRYTNVHNFIMQNCEVEPYAHLGKIDRRNIELIENPETVEKEKCGSCYDQTFLVKKWMNDENIKTRTFYSVTNNLNSENCLYYYTSSVVSHTFILCFIDDRWKWIEWSWSANIHNNFENEDINEVLKLYCQMAEKSWHVPIKLMEITDINFNLPMPRLDYLNKCLNEGIII